MKKLTMSNKSIDIVKTKYGYKIEEKFKTSLLSRTINIILLLFLSLFFTFFKFANINNIAQLSIKIFICIIVVYLIYCVLFSKKIIKISDNEIIFYFILKPWKHEKYIIKKTDLIELSINYEIEYGEGGKEIHLYNLDLVDNNLNAFNLWRIYKYELILDFGKRVESILDMTLKDKFNTEGFGNIFKKRIV